MSVEVNGSNRQSYNDEELDRLMLVPAKRPRSLGITTIEGHAQALFQEQEAVQAMIDMHQG